MDAVRAPIIWANYAPGAIARGYWDQGLLEDLLVQAQVEFSHFDSFAHFRTDAWDDGLGAVVVVPGQFNVEHLDTLNADIEQLPWLLLVVTGDEEGRFPRDKVRHYNMQVWLQTPRDWLTGDRFLPVGYPPGAPETLDQLLAGSGAGTREYDFVFAGQVTHERRRQAAAAMQAAVDGGAEGRMHFTDGFAQGLDQKTYWSLLADGRTVPCPSGPATPDSFRVWEALEAGAVPLVDLRAPQLKGTQHDFWDHVAPGSPFLRVDDWDSFPADLDSVLERWPLAAAGASSWWQQHKRQLANDLDDDIHRLAGVEPEDVGITVLIPTSPTPEHPSTRSLEEVVRSVRQQLPDAEILIGFDGVRREQAVRACDYEEYARRVCELCEHVWSGVTPVVDPELPWLHQANITRRLLELVRTPAVLFVEHDTPLTEDPIPWGDLEAVVVSGPCHVVRFHFEVAVHPEHEHLMLDQKPQLCMSDHSAGVPLLRTAQWSQRPHLASRAFYDRILDTYFGLDSRTMIEDVMHGVLQYYYSNYGEAGWEQFGVWMFAPEGSIKRSDHLDTRGDDPKYPMVYAYNGAPAPLGAPAPNL